MGKTELTKKITHELVKMISNRGMNKSYAATEVSIDHKAMGFTKHIDVLEYNRVDDEFIPYEIKITKSDFKSKYGHNFVGNYNYYVIPEKMLDFVKDHIKHYSKNKVGIMTYHENDAGHCYFKISKRCGRTQYEMDFGMRSILMYNMMKSLHRDIKKYRDLDQLGQVNSTYWHNSNKSRKEFRVFYKGEYITRQEVYERENKGGKNNV